MHAKRVEKMQRERKSGRKRGYSCFWWKTIRTHVNDVQKICKVHCAKRCKPRWNGTATMGMWICECCTQFLLNGTPTTTKWSSKCIQNCSRRRRSGILPHTESNVHRNITFLYVLVLAHVHTVYSCAFGYVYAAHLYASFWLLKLKWFIKFSFRR